MSKTSKGPSDPSKNDVFKAADELIIHARGLVDLMFSIRDKSAYIVRAAIDNKRQRGGALELICEVAAQLKEARERFQQTDQKLDQDIRPKKPSDSPSK